MINKLIKNTLLKIRRFGFYIPVTFNFLITVITLAAAFFYLNYLKTTPDSSYKDLSILLIKVMVVFLFVFVSFAFFSALIPYLIFIFSKQNRMISISPNSSSVQLNGGTCLNLDGNPLLVPFLGGIKIRLCYDAVNFTEKATVKNSMNNYFNVNLQSLFTVNLADVREYNIHFALIYFEDYFNYFSFATKQASRKYMVSEIESAPKNNLIVSPATNVSSDVRIDELKRVEGELINYKNYENSDDVRRIVWKIYAKNKELVVRIPEILDPYASHLDVYVSTFTQFELPNSKIINGLFMNNFKNKVFNVFESLQKTKLEVNMHFDQQEQGGHFDTKLDQIKYAIVKSSWQNLVTIQEFVKPKSASVLVLHSFSNARDVEDLIDSSGNQCSFIFIKHSGALNNQFIKDWLLWAFVQSNKDDLHYAKTTFKATPLYRQIVANETKLESVLKNAKKTIII